MQVLWAIQNTKSGVHSAPFVAYGLPNVADQIRTTMAGSETALNTHPDCFTVRLLGVYDELSGGIFPPTAGFWPDFLMVSDQPVTSVPLQ